jgi:hypothetical protein
MPEPISSFQWLPIKFEPSSSIVSPCVVRADIASSVDWCTRSLAQVFQFPEIKKINTTAIAMIVAGTSHDLIRFDQLRAFAGYFLLGTLALPLRSSKGKRLRKAILFANKLVTTGDPLR